MPAQPPDDSSPRIQLEFFKGWFAVQPSHSHTVELFDAIPKYVFDRHTKVSEKVGFLERQFSHRGVDYSLTITPALIKQGAKAVAVFPGVREEIVVRTILHMAVQQLAPLKMGHDKDGNVLISASFTLSQLRKHLSAAAGNIQSGNSTRRSACADWLLWTYVVREQEKGDSSQAGSS